MERTELEPAMLKQELLLLICHYTGPVITILVKKRIEHQKY